MVSAVWRVCRRGGRMPVVSAVWRVSRRWSRIASAIRSLEGEYEWGEG